MKALNRSFTYRPYYKQKERSQAGYQEANTHTNVQGQAMKNMIRKNIARKFNNKKVSYHTINT
jgi:hypothetical protein